MANTFLQQSGVSDLIVICSGDLLSKRKESAHVEQLFCSILAYSVACGGYSQSEGMAVLVFVCLSFGTIQL